VCVDLERPTLLALKRASAHATGLLTDARALPFGSNTFDAALLIGVTHHLSREALPAVAAEIAGVLMPSRHLIMLDALWAPKRLVGRAVWACDRGRHPRTAADLRAAFRAVSRTKRCSRCCTSATLCAVANV
jgi:SAM-dependent methyltransferase